MFDQLAKFFHKAEEDNTAKLNAILEIVTEVINKFPKKVREKLSGKIHPALNHTDYSIDFTFADVLWWKERNNAELLSIDEPAKIKQQIYRLLLDAMSDYATSESSSAELEAFCKAILAEIN